MLPKQLAIRDSGVLDGVVFMITEVNERTQRDHEIRKKNGGGRSAGGRIVGCSSIYRWAGGPLFRVHRMLRNREGTQKRAGVLE